MARKPYAAPLRLEIRASKLMRRLSLAMTICGSLALLFTSLPLGLRLLLVALSLLGCWLGWQRYPYLSGEGLELVWLADGEFVVNRSGRAENYRLVGARLLPWLVVLQLRPQQRRWPWGGSILLPYDAIEAETLRRLRVRLRLELSAGQERDGWRQREPH